MLLKLLLSAMLLQAIASAQQIRRIYVDGIGQNSSLQKTKKNLLAALRKLKSVQVVDSPDQANAILSGEGEIHVQGFYSLNPRSGTLPVHQLPLYSGHLAVHLENSSGATLWSYVTNASASTDAARDLSKDVVKHLATTFLGKM